MKLILASADWCVPCKAIKSRLASDNLLDRVEIKDADVDIVFFRANSIKSVPRLLVMDGETVVELVQGMEDIVARIKKDSVA
jgi:hypothetical protein